MSNDEAWLRDVLSETESDIKTWPAWLKDLLAKRLAATNAEDRSEPHANEDYEELDQQVG